MRTAVAMNNQLTQYKSAKSVDTVPSDSPENESWLLVSPDVNALIPDVMIDYLWKLALSEEYQEYEEQTFLLKPAELGREMIQVISHENDCRRVFGVEPVECELCVFHEMNCYQMALVG